MNSDGPYLYEGSFFSNAYILTEANCGTTQLAIS